jgi:SAM-dependent methyltransferase
MAKPISVENVVRQRYSRGAKQRVPALCCPVSYNTQFLKRIPSEIIERDYGCGDPSKHLRPGETVLDLGSGGGKICYIAAQVVGAKGRVIGVDMNDDMLALARKYQPAMARQLGYNNVEFHKGRIQDLALDLEVFERHLASHPVRSASDWLEAQSHAELLRQTRPMIGECAVDVVVSNCVLNLVENSDKRQLFAEIYRVLKRGGRAVISDIVSDEDVPRAMQSDPELWSGCISGAFREDLFLKAFEDAGFYGIRILERDEKPWRTVKGIEFRSMTVEAYKGKDGICLERNQAVIYKGPFREVLDDDGHRIRRGVRFAVCDKTYQIYTREPYRSHFEPVAPRKEVARSHAKPFYCGRTEPRHPRETKGLRYKATTVANNNGSACGPSCC